MLAKMLLGVVTLQQHGVTPMVAVKEEVAYGIHACK